MKRRSVLLLSIDTISHRRTGSTFVVRRQVLWNAPTSDVEVDSAPLLILESDDIVEDPSKPLRVVLLLEYSFHRVGDQPIHMYR